MDPRLKASVRTLTGWLGDTIREREGEQLFNLVEKLRLLCRDHRNDPSSDAKDIDDFIHGLTSDQAWKITRAFTLYFQLVNLAEEDQRVHRIRAYELDDESVEPMSAGHAFEELKERKVSSSRLKKALGQIEIEPVLTAHPTEAKRRSILQHLMRIASLWEALSDSNLTAQKRAECEDAIKETLEILWQTSEIRQRKLTVDNEIRNTLYFFSKTIFNATAEFHGSFARALERHYPGVSSDRAFLTYGSWVGGDRDGNPFVTQDVSLRAMRQHRELILRRYKDKLQELAAQLSISIKLSKVSSAFQRSLKRDLAAFPSVKTGTDHMIEGEYYRLKIDCISEKLDRTLQRRPGRYASSREFVEDLRVMRESLLRGGNPRAARGTLDRLIREARTFRFHLAHLDFRFHSEKVRAAALELLGHWPEESEWPGVFKANAAHNAPGRDVRRTLGDFRALNAIQEEFGESAAHRVILSMTERPGDIWATLVAAREAGLVSHGADGKIESRLDVIPLFETVPDLARSGEIMKKLWEDPIYREILRSRGNVQEIMLGYSDSNKYGGYLSANYHLYKTQRVLADLADRLGVRLRFFHGKGGSIDRGGGPSHRAILAAPDSVTGFRLRITEQGEVIAMKYGHPVIARRNLEQAAGAVLIAGLCPRASLKAEELRRFEAAMEELSNRSLAEYRNLVYETYGFKEYFSTSTPIDLLERLRIASRPTFRRAIHSIEDLRAIPWVFSWTQSRQTISAWYGLGTALEQFVKAKGNRGRKLLRRMYRSWPFFSSLIDNAQLSLAKTDMDIAERYSRLVEDEEIRKAIFDRIREEYQRTVRNILAVMDKKSLLEDGPVLKESIRLRNPYIDALNAIQIEYLRRWRKVAQSGGGENEKALEILLLATNGIAFGMKSTG